MQKNTGYSLYVYLSFDETSARSARNAREIAENMYTY